MTYPKLSRVERSRIELRTSRDMYFVVKEHGRYPVLIPRYTKCHKPAYTHEIKRRVERSEDIKRRHGDRTGDRVVCIVLEGQQRFVWRSDVYTEEEYEDAKQRDRAALTALLQESGGSVGEGDT